GQDASTVLWDRAIQGATAKYAILNEKVKERLNREYGDIRDVQGQGIELSELLLFLQDITSFLKDRELCRGVGKGKWTTSVIAYALGIVNADPLTYDLEYQTLRATHNTFPPFEIEVSSHGMEQLLAYLREKYHDDHLAAVGHRVDWKTPDLFHRLCRWANLPIVSLRDVPHSGNMSPPVVVQELKRTDWLAGKPGGTASSEQVDDLEIAGMQQLPDTDVESGSDNQPVPLSWLQYDEVKKLRHQNVRNHKTLAEAARALHPCPKGFEAQKGGYVLAKDPIHTNIPVLRTPSGRSITQSEAPLLDRLQMPRLQFSSFTMLNILEFGQNAVREESDPKFLISSIPLNDEDTWKLLGLGYTNGIPPLHSISTKSLLRAERPQSIKELLGLYIRCRKRRLTDGELAVGFESRADAVLADALSECTLGYWAAYLKTHYRPAFMISVLTHTVQTQKTTGTHRARFQILLREARKMMQLDILGPDINLSVYEFSLESRGIRTGLMAVQGMGEQTYREIANVRQGRDFSSLADFCHRTDPRSVNQTQITQLIKAGAFDALDPERNRNHLLQEYERALKNARLQSAANTRRTHGSAKSAIDAPIEQLQLFDTLVFEEESTDGDRQTQSAPLPTPQQIMQYEQESVGYIFTYDLYDQYRDLMQSMRVISPTEIHPKLEGKQIFTAGFIDHAERESPMIDGETDVVLDFEGIVVKVPRHATDFFAKVQHAQGLVLIQGMVRKQSPTEAYLIAQKFYNFDDVKRAKDETKTLQLNLTGMDQKAIAMVRSTLKNFKGNTSVEIQGVSATSWWAMRGLDKAKVLFCPPLIAALCPYPLSESQLRVIDAEGKSTKISM
ncbi:TPA: hypothetical protein DDW35_00835, partial [Candidatus Sumerlaeota bacterium]|nr:hypothetical protein [Candidatus Sumerlaeota bacterium]